MSNDNPNSMSNDDLEKDVSQHRAENEDTGNQQNVNKSTAAEGELLDPKQDPNQLNKGDGSLPDSEELSLEEEEDGYDPDKLSS